MIFTTTSLSRSVVRWEDYLHHLTPVERRGQLLFKREDYFAPLGLGFINGGKVRQGIYLLDTYARARNKHGVLGAMSVHSPQHSMQAVVAHHFELDSYHVIGGSKPESAIRHENVAIAARFGARFHIEPVAYNPMLQKAVRRLTAENPALYPLGYAISLDHRSHSVAEVRSFHALGAWQVRNVPDEIETLIIPTGSGISTTSILFGIHMYRPAALRRIFLIGIGPSKLDYIRERLKYMGVEEPSKITYFDLHGSGAYSYSDTVKADYEGIDFHPRYEAKAWTWAEKEIPEHLFNPRTLFWIVGSAPSIKNLPLAVQHQLPAPARMEMF